MLKLCTDKKNNEVLQAEVKSLIRELVEVRTEQEKCDGNKQNTEDAVAFKEVAEREVLVLTKGLEKLKISHNQSLLARNAGISNLKVQIARAQMRADDAKYERGRAKARLQQL